VVVSGLAMRGATWAFRAHVRNERNGAESIEVVGGRPGDQKIRSFEPGRIYAVTGRKAARPGPGAATGGEPSLAEAPQLPLG
jgi:hypothetical protein